MDRCMEQGRATGEAASWVARQVCRTCKASKKGKTAHISLQECYLRDDIPCGSPLCVRGCRGSPVLPAYASHYLIPDALALRHFWEMMELPQLTAVVFLSSVLKEVQMYLSGRHWKRLRSLFADKRRGNLYFDDEHFVCTKPTAENGSNDARVKDFARWLDDHLEHSLPVIIITGHIEDTIEFDLAMMAHQLQKSFRFTGETDKELKIMNVQEYVQCFWSQDRLISELCNSLVQAQFDLMQAHNNQKSIKGINDGGHAFFKNHLSAIAIEEGLQDGSLLAGIFHANKEKGGFVRPSNKGESSKLDVWIPPVEFQNRALHGDLVAVRVFSENEEISLTPMLQRTLGGEDVSGLLDNQVTLDGKDVENLDSNIEGDEQIIVSPQRAKFSGELVGILQRLQKDYAACLHETEETAFSIESKRQERLLCVPMDRRIPMVRVTTRQRSRLAGQRFVVRIDGWDADSKLPRGHVIQILGPIGDLETENRAILVENEINVLPFCTMALQELPEDTDESPWRIPMSEFAYRRDLRFLHRTYSIDPPGSKDVDDCLSVQHLDDNTLEIGVHIADVSYFVSNGSLLDLEAFSRGTTVYLVGNTYHMLPSILSENLCSLRQGKDRLAVSVIWTVDPDSEFKILNIWFGRTIIRSRQQMFYAQAQAILDKRELPDGWEILGDVDEVAQVQSDLSLLANFAQISKSLRESKGALEFVSTEMRFEMGENQEPLNVETKAQLPMNWIVAELMIQANSCVARHIYESFKVNTLLRRHTAPKQDNFSYLFKCCEAQGVYLNTSSNKALSSSLEHLQNSVDPTVKMALKALATRAMSEAEYVAAGDVFEPYNLSHYGLALEFYTHFTSPIRRYADIVVHRMLTSLCEGHAQKESRANLMVEAEKKFTTIALSQVASQLNERHRASKRAQKECNELHLLMYLQKHAQAEHAVVIEFQPHILFVYVPKYDLKGQVHLQDKAGKVILPAKDDENNGDMAPQAHLQKYTLQCSEDRICIIEVSSEEVIHEYKWMSSVWVQMKADGSRAHSPTLRLRLLSDKHPSVQEVMLKDDKQSLEYPRPPKLKSKIAESYIRNSQTSKALKEGKLTDQGKSLPQQKTQISPKVMLKPDSERQELTLHEILMEFNLKSFSASSVYLDDENFDARPSESVDTQIDTSASQETLELVNISSSMSILRSSIAVAEEKPQTSIVRKAWQEKLVEAAKQHTKQLRLRDSDDSVRAYTRNLKEMKAREEAISLYRTMELSHLVH